MLDPQSSRFWQAALTSGLMDAERLGVCWDALSKDVPKAPEQIDRRLANQAVESRLLTAWQAAQLLAGRTTGYKVDRYLILNMIGKGGMGRVYLARDSRLGREVALKILSPERLDNPRAIARFQREARVGAQLQHENLVRIYDFGESNGRYFLVMEYIDGKSIGTLISERGRIPAVASARLMRQVAMGLEHLHRKGLVHRDVNPYNIMVTHDGTAKLADLGLAIVTADEDRVTREGSTIGTFDYVAPEQAKDSRAADIRSDVYSLGCTMYHMLTGDVPFPGPSLPEKLFAHQSKDPAPVDRVVGGIPRGLAAVVERMMRKAPAERYETPALVAQALLPFLGEPARASHEKDPSVRDQPAAAERESRASEKSRQPRPELARAMVKPVGSDSPHGASSLDAGTESADSQVPLLTPDDSPETSDPDSEVLLVPDFDQSWPDGPGQPPPRSYGDHVILKLIGWLSSSGLWGLVALIVIGVLVLAILANGVSRGDFAVVDERSVDRGTATKTAILDQ